MVNLKQIVFAALSFSPLPAPRGSAVELLSRPEKSIAIVGAGSAGLAVLKTLLDLPEEARSNWTIDLFEQRWNAGGVWLPDPNDPNPPKLPETPLYPDLRTNTPAPSMTYPGFPFRPMTPLFPIHEHVEQYHLDYMKHFNLTDHIYINNTVLNSSWIGNSTVGLWNVTVRDRQGTLRSGSYDHLVVASGHNHYPYIPSWPGQGDWLRERTSTGSKREILHSIFWRSPAKYAGKTVLVVGGGASGRDAALHISPVAKRLYVSLKDGKPFPRRLPLPYIAKPSISHFTPQAIVFVDGSSVADVDYIILATGYELRIPFLTDGGAIAVDAHARSCPDSPSTLTTNLRYLFPLHEHIFSLASSYPPTALSFVGLPMLVANCPSDIAQALLVAHAIANPDILPSREDMRAQLRAKETHMSERGYDPYNVGHRLLNVDEDPDSGTSGRLPDMAHDYQDALVEFLKERGALPDDGRPFVETWRRQLRNDSDILWRAWTRVEGLGAEAVHSWLAGVESERDWVDMMRRLVIWEGDHGDDLAFQAQLTWKF